MATISKIWLITDQILQAYDTIIINFITQMYLLLKKKNQAMKVLGENTGQYVTLNWGKNFLRMTSILKQTKLI